MSLDHSLNFFFMTQILYVILVILRLLKWEMIFVHPLFDNFWNNFLLYSHVFFILSFSFSLYYFCPIKIKKKWLSQRLYKIDCINITPRLKFLFNHSCCCIVLLFVAFFLVPRLPFQAIVFIPFVYSFKFLFFYQCALKFLSKNFSSKSFTFLIISNSTSYLFVFYASCIVLFFIYISLISFIE